MEWTLLEVKVLSLIDSLGLGAVACRNVENKLTDKTHSNTETQWEGDEKSPLASWTGKAHAQGDILGLEAFHYPRLSYFKLESSMIMQLIQVTNL